MAENLKGEAVVAATRAAGWAGWAGGVVAGSGPRRRKPRSRKPGAENLGLREHGPGARGWAGLRGGGACFGRRRA